MPENYVSQNSLALKIGDFEYNIIFRTGGELVDPVRYIADRSNGLSATGLNDPYTVAGECTVDPSLLNFLINAYKTNGGIVTTSATHKAYASVAGGSTVVTTFGNARIAMPPHINPTERGAQTLVSMEFSLNDMATTEVINGQ